jgi:hypothetical protein
LLDEDVIGRPVDVAEASDGTIFVSDDYAGAVYRVTAAGARPAPSAPAAAPAAPADPLAGLAPGERDAAAERGAAHWSALGCEGCHVPERAQTGVVPVPLRALAGRYDVDALTAFLAAPTPPMPAVALAEGERRDLAIHLLERFR